MQTMGILGGSFDPVHNGHLHIATQVQKLTTLAEIRFIPCKSALLKPATHASTDDRLAMLKLAIADHPTWSVDDRETIRDTPSYTIETVQSLRTEYPATSLNLILGWDAFKDFMRWYQWEDLIHYANLIVVNRADVASTLSDQLKEYVETHLIKDPTTITASKYGKIALLTCSDIPIASREIRAKIKRGEDIQDWVPKNVCDYIQKHQLYTRSK